MNSTLLVCCSFMIPKDKNLCVPPPEIRGVQNYSLAPLTIMCSIYGSHFYYWLQIGGCIEPQNIINPQILS